MRNSSQKSLLKAETKCGMHNYSPIMSYTIWVLNQLLPFPSVLSYNQMHNRMPRAHLVQHLVSYGKQTMLPLLIPLHGHPLPENGGTAIVATNLFSYLLCPYASISYLPSRIANLSEVRRLFAMLSSLQNSTGGTSVSLLYSRTID